MRLYERVIPKNPPCAYRAFGDAAAWPVQGLLRHFRDEIEQRILEGKGIGAQAAE